MDRPGPLTEDHVARSERRRRTLGLRVFGSVRQFLPRPRKYRYRHHGVFASSHKPLLAVMTPAISSDATPVLVSKSVPYNLPDGDNRLLVRVH